MIEPHPSLSGSAFDAVARGVAQGLGRLFPPIHLPVVAEQLEQHAEAAEAVPARALPDQAAA
jgi:hypothetical protein